MLHIRMVTEANDEVLHTIHDFCLTESSFFHLKTIAYHCFCPIQKILFCFTESTYFPIENNWLITAAMGYCRISFPYMIDGRAGFNY